MPAARLKVSAVCLLGTCEQTPVRYSIVRTSGEGVLAQASSVELFEMQIRFIERTDLASLSPVMR